MTLAVFDQMCSRWPQALALPVVRRGCLRIVDALPATIEVPLSRCLRTAICEIRSVFCLLLTLETDSGRQGEGYGVAFNRDWLCSTIRFIESLKNHVLARIHRAAANMAKYRS
jgi:hypothetical protein